MTELNQLDVFTTWIQKDLGITEQKFDTLKNAEKAYVKALKQMNTVDSFNQLAVYYNTKGKTAKVHFREPCF